MPNKIITTLIIIVTMLSIILSTFACGDKPKVITDTPSEAIIPDSQTGSIAQAKTTPVTTPTTTNSPTTTPTTTTPTTATPTTTNPPTTNPPTTNPATTTPADEPEPVPGVPTVLSPVNHAVFSTGEEIEFEWEAGEGGLPSGYRWEAQYTHPVEGLRFGYWQNDNWLYFSDEFAADVTSKTMSTVERNAGRWRVKAFNRAGESEWSDWYYFGYGESVSFVNLALITWRYATYHCFSPVKTGDMITVEASFWSPQGGTGAWFLQLIDPDGNIERSWASCADTPPFYFPCEDPHGLKATHQVLQTGLYSIRVIVVKSPEHNNINISLRASPTNMDSLNSFRGNTNPGWHLVK